jgi:hypothetical protein
MKALALKIVTLCLLLITVFSCTKEDDNTETLLVGTWALTEKTIDAAPVVLSDCEEQSYIDIREKNICLLYDDCLSKATNSGWSYKSAMLNISEYLPAAFYIDHLDNSTLRLKRNDISTDGNLQVTILSYSKIVLLAPL